MRNSEVQRSVTVVAKATIPSGNRMKRKTSVRYVAGLESRAFVRVHPNGRPGSRAKRESLMRVPSSPFVSRPSTLPSRHHA
jgi:hypothetical protein